MKVFFDQRQLEHDPQFQFFAGRLLSAPEKPSRATTLLDAAEREGFLLAKVRDLGLDPILAVHSPDYLEFLKTAAALWQELSDAGPECVPHIHPVRYVRGRPEGVLGLAGYYMNGTNCPIGSGTWSAAYWSAQTALAGAAEIAAGARLAYALCRPPGHHAHRDMAGGFCFLNNAAIAAEYLLSQFQRVAILDVDVHHGNGTQEIFYGRNDVFCGSVHGDPIDFYPFFQGYTTERGEGVGEGFNLNLPLPDGSGDSELAGAVRQLCSEALTLGCEAIVLALGLDAFEKDTMGKFAVTTPGFGVIAEIIYGTGLPLLLVQEGGYDGPHLASNLTSFLDPLTEAKNRQTG